jgi:hypothetical protein
MYAQHVPSGGHVKAIMEKRDHRGDIDGMILGISHAEDGIIPERMSDGCFVNLSLSSQDIYYNYATLRYCAACHMDKLRCMSMLIVDMFDYTYFNYDVSLCKEIRNYLAFGGIEDPHNYPANKNYSLPWDELVRQAQSVHFASQNRNRIVKDDDVEKFPFSNVLRTKRFEATIQENVAVFHKLLELARDINPSMRIVCLILPRFYKTRERLAAVLDRWRAEYLDIIRDAQERHAIAFLDYTDHAISTHRELYYDAAHLNAAGAVAFSDLLRSDLRKLYEVASF